VPSGASTGAHEAVELRDGDPKRYHGLGVLKACKNVNDKIAKAVAGMSVMQQEQIDQAMIKLDGTDTKRKLGANATLSVSLAVARLAAQVAKQELFAYLAERYAYKPHRMPVPLFNVINGGKHATSGLDIQEFFIIPQKGSFKERLRHSTEVYQTLKRIIAHQFGDTSLGDEGGFAPHLKSNEKAMQLLIHAIEKTGFKAGKDFMLGLDAAASEFFDPAKGVYRLTASQSSFKPVTVYKFYQHWLMRFPIALIEDGCSEDDVIGWKLLTQELSKKVLLVGDDLFVTNLKRIQTGLTQKLANAVLIKPNQIGTLTETVAAVQLAQHNRYSVVMSHRSGETTDSFIADLAVAVNADYIKAGAPARGERLAKYNRLLAIEEQLK
jgi:enolase